MRTYFEDLEEQHLASFAIKSKTSKGQQFSETLSDTRTLFQRDRDRIIHAKSFRRLKHKTQVFVANNSDHYRSRLTHTLEVAQISRHLARLLKINEDLAESIALAHDLGHTPFGHAGEKELDFLMRDYGGFEHNLQSLRVVDFLENKNPQFKGLNLSFEVRQGLMKHAQTSTYSETPPFTSLEAQIVNLADAIAYNNHDIDDGIHSNILKESDLEKHIDLWKEAKKDVLATYQNIDFELMTHLTISKLITTLIIDLQVTTQKNILTLNIKTLTDLQQTSQPVASHSKEVQEKCNQLRTFLHTHFYNHHHVYRMSQKGQRIIRELFIAFTQDTYLLPISYREKLKTTESKERIIADYIAGMTDLYAKKEYNTIYA